MGPDKALATPAALAEILCANPTGMILPDVFIPASEQGGLRMARHFVVDNELLALVDGADRPLMPRKADVASFAGLRGGSRHLADPVFN
jgi:hypothetical protein